MPLLHIKKMQTWCIYIDESGVNEDNPEFIYAAICVPFSKQQEFFKSYPNIVNPLVPIYGREIKYGDLLNNFDRSYSEKDEQVCNSLLEVFFGIKDAKIIRVKAIRKQMRAQGGDLRKALFRKTLECCRNLLPSDCQAMILHDELDGRRQQIDLLNVFNSFNIKAPKGSSFQNCVFVHSNENPFIQFADFVASICYRYYYYQRREPPKQLEFRSKKLCASLVDTLFKAIDKHHPPIVELSEHTDVKDNPRKKQAVQLASEHEIPLVTAYNIIDENITLTEALRRKQASQLASEHEIRFETACKIVDNKITLEEVLKQKQAQTATPHRQNEDKSKIPS